MEREVVHNPAWRPARLHSERLSGIQHHFIDARPAASDTGQQELIRTTLPVHMAIAPEHPADALQPHSLVDALTLELNRQNCAGTGSSDWRLETFATDTVATHAAGRFILVFATASLAGVRLAYAAIKMLSADPSRQFGVLFSGAHDGVVASRCQERLASGTQRFLGIRIQGLGHISANGPYFSADLARLARDVQRFCETRSIPDQPEVNHT